MAGREGAVHVATTRRKHGEKVYETHLLRRTYREGGSVKHETLGNISHLPPNVIEMIRLALKGEAFLPASSSLEIVRSLPHGHVACVLGTMRSLGLEGVISSRPSRERDEKRIEDEAALDGIYVIRTSVPAQESSPEEAVRACKDLSRVEQAFCCLKTVDLKVRPINHRKPDRVRAHVFICMLAYYVEWHMRRSLAPVLFDEEEREPAEALRESVAAPAARTPQAKRKAARKRSEEALPVHSFQTLLADLRTIARNRIHPTGQNDSSAFAFDLTTTPTPLQRKALDLLGVSLSM